MTRTTLPAHGRTRRRLGQALAAAAALPLPALGQGARHRSLRVAQLLDSSADQQELSRDYSTGVRLALAEANQAGRGIQLVNFSTDGSPASLRQALDAVRDDTSLCALLGTAGDRLAVASIGAARAAGLSIAHVAPWMSDSRFDGDEQVFPLFASRETQIRHALKSLETLGVTQLGVVYPSPAAQAALQDEVGRLAGRLQLRALSLVPGPGEDATALVARLTPQSPVILLFLGGTVELARFSQALGQRNLQRYVVSLSDVDVPTLMQLGTGRSAPLILTQVVPNPQTSSLPVVREYRGRLKQLFEEAPSHVSLAGYLAARYAAGVLGRLDGSATRAQVLAEFQKRPAADLGGFGFSFGASRRGSSFVTQTLLGADGRLIG